MVELGNTVVDPAARGGGLAWKVGAELSSWCRELGYQGFLHYPTTDHHIMQRQSVKAGFETGLMLGYIPAETHGQVGEAGGRSGNVRLPPSSMNPTLKAPVSTAICPRSMRSCCRNWQRLPACRASGECRMQRPTDRAHAI